MPAAQVELARLLTAPQPNRTGILEAEGGAAKVLHALSCGSHIMCVRRLSMKTMSPLRTVGTRACSI